MQVLAISTSAFQVLVPVNMVAQIIGPVSVAPAESMIRGMDGEIPWREFMVPLLHTAELFTGHEGLDLGYERIVVLWPMKSAGNRGFISMTSMTAPRVIEVEDQDFSDLPADFEFCMGAVHMGDNMSLIPDLEKVSTTIYPPSE